MPKSSREIPADEFSQRRLAQRFVRAINWLYRREVKRAMRGLPRFASKGRRWGR